ncbi:hypothetical protein [Nocardia carnea]|uniref:hypothetical protein n=1 Tax=Nocardia carnea TaxID=37328 RepID=UPI0024576DF2|nr:hypothetical protein [Nocardia carnea]
MRFVSYNLLDYGLDTSSEGRAHRHRVHEVIRELRPDVPAVRELRAHTQQSRHPEFVCRCRWDCGSHDRRNRQADREPGEVRYAGGLTVAAVTLGAPQPSTAGHWPVGK